MLHIDEIESPKLRFTRIFGRIKNVLWKISIAK